MAEMTPEQLYKEYLAAEERGDVERQHELERMADGDDDLEAAILDATATINDRIQEWLDHGGSEIVEQQMAIDRAMWRQKIRRGEVPFHRVLQLLAEDAGRVARICKAMGGLRIPAMMDSVFRRMKNVRIAYEVHTEDEEERDE